MAVAIPTTISVYLFMFLNLPFLTRQMFFQSKDEMKLVSFSPETSSGLLLEEVNLFLKCCLFPPGGFTVRTERLTFINSPFQVSFPFPHSAILEDLDGSITGQKGSRLVPSTDILAVSCTTSANFSQASSVSVCGSDIVFHRMSLHL